MSIVLLHVFVDFDLQLSFSMKTLLIQLIIVSYFDVPASVACILNV